MDHEAGVLRILQAEEPEVIGLMERMYIALGVAALFLLAFCIHDDDGRYR